MASLRRKVTSALWGSCNEDICFPEVSWGYRHTRSAKDMMTMMMKIVMMTVRNPMNTFQGVGGKNRSEGKKDGQGRAKEAWQPSKPSRNFLFLSFKPVHHHHHIFFVILIHTTIKTI